MFFHEILIKLVLISSTIKLKINCPENCDVLTKICMYFKVENLISWFVYWAPLGCRRERELSYYRNSGHAHQQLHHCTVHSAVLCCAILFRFVSLAVNKNTSGWKMFTWSFKLSAFLFQFSFIFTVLFSRYATYALRLEAAMWKKYWIIYYDTRK